MTMPIPRRADDPPIPPELAADKPPMEAEALERITQAAVELSALSEVPVATAARDLATATRGEEGATDARVRWRIEDDGAAEWAMAHVAEAADQVARLAVERDAYRERIDNWFHTKAAQLEATAGFFASHLEDYALRKRAADPRAKTVSLPSGKVRTRETPARVVVEDTDAFVKWATEVDQGLLRVKVEPVAAEVKERLDVRRQIVGERYELTLECGHQVEWERTLVPDPAGQVEPVPKAMACRDSMCLTSRSKSVTGQRLLEELIEVTVRHADTGHEAVGVRVDPPSVSATVAPGG